MVVLQIVDGHDAAGLANRGCKLFCNRAPVKSLWAVARNVAERRREIGLLQILSRRQHGTITVEKNRCARMPARNALLRQWQRVGDIVDDVDAVTCECDCRFDQVGKRQLAGTVFFMGEGEAGDSPGTPTDSALSRDFFGSGSPLASRNIVSVAAAGAVSR